MNQTGREAADRTTAKPGSIDRVVALLPGARAGAPKRNTLVLLAYLLAVLVVAGASLRLL
jgi:hypothetical protein